MSFLEVCLFVLWFDVSLKVLQSFCDVFSLYLKSFVIKKMMTIKIIMHAFKSAENLHVNNLERNDSLKHKSQLKRRTLQILFNWDYSCVAMCNPSHDPKKRLLALSVQEQHLCLCKQVGHSRVVKRRAGDLNVRCSTPGLDEIFVRCCSVFPTRTESEKICLLA